MESLDSIVVNGQEYQFNGGGSPTDKVDISNGAILLGDDKTDWVDVKTDSNNKIIEAIDKNGKKFFFGDVEVKGTFTAIGSAASSDVGFLQNCHFIGLEEEAANGKELWSSTDLIENIYEPLRAQYPQYIKRKSIGKDQSNQYDMWVYEFDNSVNEFFSLANNVKISDNILLPSTNGLTSKQVAITNEKFNATFSSKKYAALYPLSTFSVRKPSLAETTEQTINGVLYKVLTCNDNIKVENGGVTIYWTFPIKTYDQHVMIISGTHADESAGYLGTALAIKYMIEHHTENPSLDYIFNHVKLTVLPVLNVWGTHQTPKSRAAMDGSATNVWNGVLNKEQQQLSDFVATIKDDLSFFADFHTSELWNNYGFVYAILGDNDKNSHAPLIASANYLCRHWFPTETALNWNVGRLHDHFCSNHYMQTQFGIENSMIIEFCGQDLMAFTSCQRWDAKYMTYAVENYLNFMIALCCARFKHNEDINLNKTFFSHETMT